ncbi:MULTISPECIES: shikimate dehydrogenase [unclassified Luteimonas]|uniref:shikimate dehydrogenase n=1 Tax=unclassified Luteimonas TaxID=2629088 RepID=UPI0015FEF2E9|nr:MULTISPECIES: shikimate dehydrogenase [unclassified Luteimonas]MBB1473409.1 shikimate dehydrogenase [Luteimonas sp. MC1782]MBB6600421.1 shikimate dehydrogenase [Luteimonas sp. MC1825]QOC88088.1 shikimate dehydrogenase [Luteimonas sp. MC1825]
MKHYAVFGHPVSHSLSPRIHAAFGRETGIPVDYVAIDADADGFRHALQAFASRGGAGANVTLPLKQLALDLCDDVTERARRAGAVNTLVRNGDTWHGDNTDGDGLVRDLTGRHALDLRARRTLLIGAGGAARGVAPALLDAGIGDLFIVNRTSAHADALADGLGQPGRVHPRHLSDIGSLGEFELVVNATSAARNTGLMGLPRSLVGRRMAAVDLNYGEAAVPFLAWARASGAHAVVDGLGMLVEQAALGFARWHGVEPETDEIYGELRAEHNHLITAD